jgi:hypothetical protein
MAMTTTDCIVAIIWATNTTDARTGDDLDFHFLAYNGGNGAVRTYHRDQYDARCDLGRDRAKDGPLPYFGNWQHAERFLLASPDRTLIQIEIRALRRPFPRLELASVAAERQCDGNFPDPETRNVGEV